MLADMKCIKCKHVVEKFYFSFKEMENTSDKCPKCSSPLKRIYSHYHIGYSGEVPGYEKVNQDHMTIGKGADAKQAWV